jgi:ATP-dependent DNA helicase PIF1
VRSRGDITLAVASSGIAALLLSGGRTAHSYLKIPIALDHTSFCYIRKQDDLAALIRQTKLILWDEAPMTNKLAFEAVDRSLRDLIDKNEPFGGIVFVMSGDFRQVLPVIPRGSHADIVSASIKNSYLWESVEVFRHSENMWAGDAVAVHSDLGNRTFADWLLCLGNNELETIDEDYIKCPNMMILPPTDTRAMAVAIYPRLQEGRATNEYLRDRAILAPRNKEVSLINTMVLSYFLGMHVDFFSADSAEDTEVANTYPFEFLNTLEISGMPSHKLSFKIGAPVMLLRNLDPSAGLCNGTRLIIRRFTMRVVEAEIMTGKGAGNVAFIPRIKFISDNSGLPFTFTRKQFPLRLAYAMTINKSQGQTLSHVGLHLADDVFSHGQLYVAFSRAKALANVKVQLPDTMHGRIGLMRNVVYKEALL